MTRAVAHPVSTHNLRTVLVALRDGTITRDELRDEMQQTARRAREQMMKAKYDVLLQAGAAGLRKDLSKAEANSVRAALRAGDRAPFRAALSESFTQEKLHDYLHRCGVPFATARRLAGFPSFAALELLSALAVSFRWTVMCGIEGTKSLENDGADIESVVIALYGRDFFSDDSNARALYEDMLAIIAKVWG